MLSLTHLLCQCVKGSETLVLLYPAAYVLSLSSAFCFAKSRWKIQPIGGDLRERDFWNKRRERKRRREVVIGEREREHKSFLSVVL
jgi:hypothetical protein